MIEETARVVAVDADVVWVEARRESACGRCALQSGCGHGLLDRLRRAPVIRLRLPRASVAPEVGIRLRVGEQVVLGISEHAVLRGSLRMYALPLIAMLLGTLIGDSFGGGSPDGAGAAIDADLLAALGGAVGLLLGLLAVFVTARRRPMEMPRLLRVLPAGSGPAGEDIADATGAVRMLP